MLLIVGKFYLSEDVRYLTISHMQQTILGNIVAKGVIAQHEEFLLWPQYFQSYSILTLLEILYTCTFA